MDLALSYDANAKFKNSKKHRENRLLFDMVVLCKRVDRRGFDEQRQACVRDASESNSLCISRVFEVNNYSRANSFL